MDSNYEAEEVRVFAKLIHKGLIYRGTKPVFWCFKLKTALAFSEAEYREHKSPSIYVKFYLDSNSEEKNKFQSSRLSCDMDNNSLDLAGKFGHMP